MQRTETQQKMLNIKFKKSNNKNDSAIQHEKENKISKVE